MLVCESDCFVFVAAYRLYIVGESVQVVYTSTRIIAMLFLAAVSTCAQDIQAAFKFPLTKNAWLRDGRILNIPNNSNLAKTQCSIISNKGVVEYLDIPTMRKGIPTISAPTGEIFCEYSKKIKSDQESDEINNRIYETEIFKYNMHKKAWDKARHGRLVWKRYVKTFVLSEDYIVGVASRPDDFISKNDKHLFAIFKRNNRGEYEISHYEDVGFGKGPINSRGDWNYPVLSTLWSTVKSYWCREHLALVSPHGLVWFFDENGRMERFNKLYGAYDENCLRSKILWPGAVLGCQPNQTGGLLISALAEDAIDKGIVEANRQETTRFDMFSQASRDHSELKTKMMFASVLSDSPSIYWFTIYPDQSRIIPTGPPHGLPWSIKSQKEYFDFNWMFKPDGNLYLFNSKQWETDNPNGNNKVKSQYIMAK